MSTYETPGALLYHLSYQATMGIASSFTCKPQKQRDSIFLVVRIYQDFPKITYLILSENDSLLWSGFTTAVFSLVFRVTGKSVFQTGKAALLKVFFYPGVELSS